MSLSVPEAGIYDANDPSAPAPEYVQCAACGCDYREDERVEVSGKVLCLRDALDRLADLAYDVLLDRCDAPHQENAAKALAPEMQTFRDLLDEVERRIAAL